MIILVGLLLLGLVITIHELGHFLAAKALGIRVLTFSIGMGPRIWQRKIGETVYCLSWVPLGGYVRPLALVAEEDSQPQSIAQNPIENLLDKCCKWMLPLTAEERVSNSQELVNTRQNLLTRGFFAHALFILAGCAANVLSAYFFTTLAIFSFATVEEIKSPPAFYRIATDSLLEQAGARRDEKILSVDGHQVKTWMGVLNNLRLAHSESRANSFEVEDLTGAKRVFSVSPVTDPYSAGKDLLTILNSLGIKPATESRPFKLSESFHVVNEMMKTFWSTALGIKSKDNPQGRSGLVFEVLSPVTSVMDLGVLASESGKTFLLTFFTASLVVVLINLLPIPGIDGGQFVVAVLEHLFKVPVTPYVRLGLTRCAIGLMLVLTIYGFGKDIVGS